MKGEVQGAEAMDREGVKGEAASGEGGGGGGGGEVSRDVTNALFVQRSTTWRVPSVRASVRVSWFATRYGCTSTRTVAIRSPRFSRNDSNLPFCAPAEVDFSESDGGAPSLAVPDLRFKFALLYLGRNWFY